MSDDIGAEPRCRSGPIEPNLKVLPCFKRLCVLPTCKFPELSVFVVVCGSGAVSRHVAIRRIEELSPSPLPILGAVLRQSFSQYLCLMSVITFRTSNNLLCSLYHHRLKESDCD